jgi:hypothetical protein
MASPNNISSPTVSATPEQISHKNSTPLAQKVHTDTSDTFEDTPVMGTDISLPHLVAPGKGYGRIPKPDSSTAAALHNEVDDGEMALASPIFNYGAQYPALDGDVPENMMEGVEQNSNSGSENNSCEERNTHLLTPSVKKSPDISQCGVNSGSRVQIEWIGTSTFFLEHNLELQGAVSFSCKLMESL